MNTTSFTPQVGVYLDLGGPAIRDERGRYSRPRVPLEFTERGEDGIWYRTPDGEDVCLAHRTGQRLIDFDDLVGEMPEIWAAFSRQERAAKDWVPAFRDLLRARTHEPDRVDDEINFCMDCLAPDHEDDQTSTYYGSVCERCADNYWFCEDCEERFRHTTTTLHETQVCESCRLNNWSWCDDCDGYYRDDDAGDHQHSDDDDDSSDCCESPALSFSIRNDGKPPLANEVEVTVGLPSGEITEEGLFEIACLLRLHAGTFYQGLPEDDMDAHNNWWQASYQAHELGNAWQTKEGNYTKRLSRALYKTRGLKMPPELMSNVGNIARAHSAGKEYLLAVTRNLDMSASEYAHSDSCWWGSYSHSRCTLKSNGGFALRSFSSPHGGVDGRAWVMPLRYRSEGSVPFRPTFETLTPDAFLVFNGYGTLSGYTPARIVAHMAGMTYRKVSLTVEYMYINNNMGYLVAPEEIAEKFTDGQINLAPDQHADLFNIEAAEAANTRELINA